ncbi:MAG: hypothetical protein FWC60_07245, partial [Firmicutes bacterium]|nr:hypothetical protein [Bacillota bacterium]
MSKYKECPKCYRKNFSYADKCEHCGMSLASAPVKESTGQEESTQPDSEFSGFSSFLSALSYISLIAGIVGCAVALATSTWVSSPLSRTGDRIFSPAELGLALGLLFSGFIFFGVLGGL